MNVGHKRESAAGWAAAPRRVAHRWGRRHAPQVAKPGRIARNTAIFSILTGLSRIAGLIREIVASSYFGTSGPISAFTFAFQVPNLVRTLFADAALSAAFVPVFTELLEKGRKREAFQLASTFFALITAALTAICVIFILVAPWIMPPLTGDFSPELDHLMVGLSQVLFPIVLLLGLNGLVVGILNAYDEFTIPALAPLVWNFVIIGLLVGLKPHFEGPDQLYAYAIGVLAGTIVQLLMCLPSLRRLGFAFELKDRPARSARAPGAHADAADHAQPRAHQLRPVHQLDARLDDLRLRRRARSTARSGSTCCRRGCSASPSPRSCSRRSRGWPRARTSTGCAR